MAQQVNVVLVDDLDGSEAGETVVFGLDGTTYEIDLSEKNAKKLRDSIALYVASARRTGGRRGTARTAGRAPSTATSTDTASVRTWAKSKGYEVSDRGRISAEILDAYKKANRK
ncbi:MAG TPA: Lsr2 family protein [Actinopolymorphaceae bacterium]